jgi:D-glycero-D-manno-heptose 1,7-bisphosphate phosphatase
VPEETSRQRAVFLDRDGVLNYAPVVNGRPQSPQTVDELAILPGVPAACAALRRAGYLLIVVTNQPDVARGRRTREQVDAINRALEAQVDLDDIRVCPHDDGDQCGCRKPAAGLLIDAARDWRVDLQSSVMIGDRWQDIEAGRTAGCRTVFIDRKYLEPRPNRADATVRDLGEGVSWILRAAQNARDEKND